MQVSWHFAGGVFLSLVFVYFISLTFCYSFTLLVSKAPHGMTVLKIKRESTVRRKATFYDWSFSHANTKEGNEILK